MPEPTRPPAPTRSPLGRALRAFLAPAGLASLLTTCHAAAERSEPVAVEAGGEATLAPLDVARARPADWVREVRAALELGDAERASELLDGLAGSARPDELAWLRAEVAEARADAEAQRTALEVVVEVGGPLAPWARLTLAQLAPDHAAEVLAEVRALDWPAALDVSLALAGSTEDLAALASASPDCTDCRRTLADRLAESDDAAQLEEALGHYRALDARAPTSELEERIAAVLARLPAERREALAEPPLALRLARAEALAAQQRHETSERAYADVARAARGSDDPDTHAIRCQAELGVGRARFRRRAREEAIEALDAMAERCADVADAGAWGRYFAAKSYANLDRRTEAVAAWGALATSFADHRLADDARIEAARLLVRMGDPDGAEEHLRAVTAMATPGDMRGEARFLLAWIARGRGDLAGALASLEASLAEGTGEEAEDVRGRAAYWRAVILRELGRQDEGTAALVALAAAEPLAFYGQEARARLLEIDPARVLVLPAAEVTLVPDVSPSETIERALALLRVGEGALAARELQHAGVTSSDATEATSWWAAAILSEGGAHHRAVELARRRLAATLSARSGEALWSRASVAYPRAYDALIAGAASDEGIPPSLVFAIAREESSFEPRAVSVAHAYGMLQIIRPTARSIAERLGLPSDVRALSRPDVSVRIGARYLRDLSRRYEDNPSVVPAAYNAGQGAVDRWLRTGGDRRLDEWIEEIPYAETRRYTRRVLMSQGIYEWLLHGELPTRSPRLPRRG